MLILKIKAIKAIKLCRLFFKWTAGVSTVLNPSRLFSVGIYIYIYIYIYFFLPIFLRTIRTWSEILWRLL